MNGNPKLITEKPAREGKTSEQWEYIDKFFFYQNGCLKKEMQASEYLNRVIKKQQSLNLKQKALDKLGIDESDIMDRRPSEYKGKSFTEVEPVEFTGFSFTGEYMAKGGLSSKYETTWVFFGEKQVYVYNYIFDMTGNAKYERTEEYFYKDITNFSSSTETVEIAVPNKGCMKNQVSIGTTDITRFCIVVPGERFSCATQGTAEVEAHIQAMKQKLREKKNV